MRTEPNYSLFNSTSHLEILNGAVQLTLYWRGFLIFSVIVMLKSVEQGNTGVSATFRRYEPYYDRHSRN